MVTLICYILSLFEICELTWLAVLIDCAVITAIHLPGATQGYQSANLLCTIGIIVFCFAFYKYFFELKLSAWWILATPLVLAVAVFFPGGITIMHLLLKKWGLMILPKWGLITGIVFDVIYLLAVIAIIIEAIKDKKKATPQ